MFMAKNLDYNEVKMSSIFFIFIALLISFIIFYLFRYPTNNAILLRYSITALFTTFPFITIWNIWFTQLGVWNYNAFYFSGIYIFQTPIESIIILGILPVAFICLHEWTKNKFQILHKIEAYHRFTTLLFSGIAASLLFWYHHKVFTGITLLLLLFNLLTHLIVIKRHYMNWLYFSILIVILPLFVSNIFLANVPIMLFKNSETIGFQILNIPVELFIFQISVLMLNTGVYEWTKRIQLKRNYRISKKNDKNI